ncbi:hypothetical protein [Chitinophaga pinensis]|uniref:Uncharacterized protein n=1 Tax=Chitinophaga pinensis TaxID=79329 RepID=A0A5C6LYT9_9BACT|nr:hypothetical protein [Chitinophaga pinensis]TWW02595.1 hypothetical protein FEF09_01965 [Chitinophaga pinensis]
MPAGFLGILVNGVDWGFVATNDIADILVEDPRDIRRNWVVSEQGKWQVVKFPISAASEVDPAVPDEKAAYYSL